MAERVVTELEALILQRRGHVRVLDHLLADHEEGGRHVQSLEQGRNPRRPARVRPVVEGERDAAADRALARSESVALDPPDRGGALKRGSWRARRRGGAPACGHGRQAFHAEQQKQTLREFAANAEDVLARTGDLLLLDETDDTLLLRSDGRFETSLDLSDMPAGSALNVEAHRSGLTVTEARVIADFYDPADVLQWVTDALSERYPHVDFSAVYE